MATQEKKKTFNIHFKIPAIQDNPTGWGPCDVPDQFKDIPYQPFSKGDRLGKVSFFFSYRLKVMSYKTLY